MSGPVLRRPSDSPVLVAAPRWLDRGGREEKGDVTDVPSLEP